MKKPATILKRFGHKGQFVKWPVKWEKRMPHTGKRRFDTYCDLLLGICACGDRHCEGEDWLVDLLQQYNCCIESHGDWLARTRANIAAEVK